MTAGEPCRQYLVNRRVILIIGIIMSLSAILTIGADLLSEDARN